MSNVSLSKKLSPSFWFTGSKVIQVFGPLQREWVEFSLRLPKHDSPTELTDRDRYNPGQLPHSSVLPQRDGRGGREVGTGPNASLGIVRLPLCLREPSRGSSVGSPGT